MFQHLFLHSSLFSTTIFASYPPVIFQPPPSLPLWQKHFLFLFWHHVCNAVIEEDACMHITIFSLLSNYCPEWLFTTIIIVVSFILTVPTTQHFYCLIILILWDFFLYPTDEYGHFMSVLALMTHLIQYDILQVNLYIGIFHDYSFNS